MTEDHLHKTVRLSLPYPEKVLWPNGRTKSHRFRAARFKKAKNDAFLCAKASTYRPIDEQLVSVDIEVHPKARGPLPDADNCIAAAKAYLDGIAAAIGIDDKHFMAPTLRFSDVRDAQFVITIGSAE